MAEMFTVMLSTAGAYSSTKLCVQLLSGEKTLGDFQDQQLTVVFGLVAIVWVALLTVTDVVKNIELRNSIDRN